jgi:hypothetical protein
VRSIVLGHVGRKPLELDLDVLLRTRLLIQAGSGGGKSWALRRLAEQLFGKVQVFLIDREGEFSTLREKYGYVLVGQDMDTPADVRSARQLAEKLLEINASAVCDLYEAFRSKPGDRRAWVRGFLEGVMDAPKKFWRDLVVIVDEAHLFCPQETPKAASMVEREIISGCKEAMIALATAGRKRGYCAVWATQRLAKLDKDASAELLNRVVGMTIEDVDVDRAAELMSVSRDEKPGFKTSLKGLEPGNFYAFGRAISKERVLVRVGTVTTTHPEPGSSGQVSGPPPPPEKVKAMLAKLANFPREVEAKAKTESELRAEIRSLKTQLASRPKEQVTREVTKTEAKEIPIIHAKDLTRLEKIVESLVTISSKTADAATNIRGHADRMRGDIEAFNRKLKTAPRATLPVTPTVRGLRPVVAPPRSQRPHPAPSNGGPLGRSEKAILSVLAQYPGGCMIGKIALLAGYRLSGGFRNSFSKLRHSGYLAGANTGTMTVTEEGVQALGPDFTPRPEGEALGEYWQSHPSFGVCERRIVSALRQHPEGLTIDELAQAASYSISGGFRNSISKVRTAGVLVGKSTERMKPTEELVGV